MQLVTARQHDLLRGNPAIAPDHYPAFSGVLDGAVRRLPLQPDAPCVLMSIPATTLRMETLKSSGWFALSKDYSAGHHARCFALDRQLVVSWARRGIADALEGQGLVDAMRGERGMNAVPRGPRIVDDNGRPPVPRTSPAWLLLRALQGRPCPVDYLHLAKMARTDATALAAAHALTRLGLKPLAEDGTTTYSKYYQIWDSGRLGEVLGGMQGVHGDVKRLALIGDVYDLANCQPRILGALAVALGVDPSPLYDLLADFDDACLRFGVPRKFAKVGLTASCMSGRWVLRADSRMEEDEFGVLQRKETQLQKAARKFTLSGSTSGSPEDLVARVRDMIGAAADIQRSVAKIILDQAALLCRYIDRRGSRKGAPPPERSVKWADLPKGARGLYVLEAHADGVDLRNAGGAVIPLLSHDGKRAEHKGRDVSVGRMMAQILQGAEVATMWQLESLAAEFDYEYVHHDHAGGVVRGQIPSEAVLEVRRRLPWASEGEVVELIHQRSDGAKISVATGAPVAAKRTMVAVTFAPTSYHEETLQPWTPPPHLALRGHAHTTQPSPIASTLLPEPPPVVVLTHTAPPSVVSGAGGAAVRETEVVRLTSWYQACLDAFVAAQTETTHRTNHLLDDGDIVSPPQVVAAADLYGLGPEEYLAYLAAANVEGIVDRGARPTWARQAHGTKARALIDRLRAKWAAEPDGGNYARLRFEIRYQRLNKPHSKEQSYGDVHLHHVG